MQARAGFPVRPWPYHQRPRRRQCAAPPILELIPEDGDVRWLSELARDVVGKAEAHAVLDAATPGAEDLDAGDPAKVRALMIAVAEDLHISDTSLRFPRLHLVNYLSGLALPRRASAELVDALLDKLREYRSRRGSGSASRPGLLEAVQTLNPWPIIIAIAALVAPELFFRMWFNGAPGVGRECRWLRYQHKALAADKSFNTFLLGLTRQPQATTAGVDIGLLATWAFLADLRAAYQPRRWRSKAGGWRRPSAPVLLLDQLPQTLPGLVATARKRGRPDPLLIIVVPRDQAGDRGFPRKAVRVARDQHDDEDEVWRPGRKRKLLVVAGVIGLAALAAVLATIALPRSQPVASPTTRPTSPPPGACPSLPPHAAVTSLASWLNNGPGDTECVGYSTTVPFANSRLVDAGNTEQALQDKRLVYDQQQVFSMDKLAGQYESSRTVLTLVYFAGLTAAPNDDYDSGEAEELEGLLVAQRLAYSETSGPMLKVVVANGGSKMRDAVAVAKLLIPLFRGDPGLLGVIGMDRSVVTVQQAIALFRGQGIPVVATTLSADGIGAGDPSYFEMVPDNTQEAELILGYIRDGVTAYFRQPASVYYSRGQLTPSLIWIYYPPSDPGDYYISTLVADLQRVRRTEPQFRGLPQVVPTSKLGVGLCGADRVVVYAGRHDLPPGSRFNSFANFLRTIDEDCPLARNRPFVIADDGVGRFITDPAARVQPGMGQESISYVSKAIAILQTRNKCLDEATAGEVPGVLVDFCQTYAGIVADLRKELGNQVPFLWTDDRVGLAYDAARLFIVAAENQPGQLITRAQIPTALESQPYTGVTGTVNFTASHIGSNTSGGMPMAIVRIEVSSRTAAPTCEYPAGANQILGYPSNGNSGPYLPCTSLSD